MRTKFLAAPMLGLAVLVAACSGGGATTAPTTAPTAAPSAPASEAPASEAPGSEAPASPAAGGAATVNVGDLTLGKVLVDGAGKTLYVFTPDGTGGKSTCTGECLTNWPALESDGAPALGEGLDAEDFGSTTREDNGATQVTFYGMPLYYFAGDTKAGDVNGQGLGDKWYVVDAEGKMIK